MMIRSCYRCWKLPDVFIHSNYSESNAWVCYYTTYLEKFFHRCFCFFLFDGRIKWRWMPDRYRCENYSHSCIRFSLWHRNLVRRCRVHFPPLSASDIQQMDSAARYHSHQNKVYIYYYFSEILLLNAQSKTAIWHRKGGTQNYNFIWNIMEKSLHLWERKKKRQSV